MDAFIKQVSSSAGVDEAEARSFLGKLLDFIKKNSPEDVSADISAKVPGADEVMKDATAPSNDLLKQCMPVLDMLKKLVEQVMGGDAAKAAELTEICTKSGVTPEQGGAMIQKLLEFLKDKVGPDTVTKITEQLPALQAVGA